MNREIFRYHDGTKDVAVDPIKVYRTFTMQPGLNLILDAQALTMWQRQCGAQAEWDGESELSFSEVQKQIETKGLQAFERLLSAARIAFKVPEFCLSDDGEECGLMDSEVMTVLFIFMDWLGTVKKNTSAIPT